MASHAVPPSAWAAKPGASLIVITCTASNFSHPGKVPSSPVAAAMAGLPAAKFCQQGWAGGLAPLPDPPLVAQSYLSVVHSNAESVATAPPHVLAPNTRGAWMVEMESKQ